MKLIAFTAACAFAALSASGSAQEAAPVAPGPTCYIEVRGLMAAPPAGIGELGTAIQALDAALRPKVVEINTLKAQLARLEQREVAAAPATSIEAAFAEDDDAAPQAPSAVDERTSAEITRVQADIDAKQAQLKLDYAAQQQAIVGPVQARINRGAQAFVANSGCAEVKMARAAEIAALTTAGARNVTGEFIAWYAANPPA